MYLNLTKIKIRKSAVFDLVIESVYLFVHLLENKILNQLYVIFQLMGKLMILMLLWKRWCSTRSSETKFAFFPSTQIILDAFCCKQRTTFLLIYRQGKFLDKFFLVFRFSIFQASQDFDGEVQIVIPSGCLGNISCKFYACLDVLIFPNVMDDRSANMLIVHLIYGHLVGLNLEHKSLLTYKHFWKQDIFQIFSHIYRFCCFVDLPFTWIRWQM